MVGFVKTRSVYFGLGSGEVGTSMSGSFKKTEVWFRIRTVLNRPDGGQIGINAMSVYFRVRSSLVGTMSSGSLNKKGRLRVP